jgi:lactoylglutathione lyase
VQLTFVRLLVDRYDECFRFYRDTLGLPPTFGDESSGYANFRAGEAQLALFERTEQGEVVGLQLPGDRAVVVFAVEDVDAQAERLRDHVVAGPTDRRDWGIRVLYLRDPDGNLVELNQQIPMEE